MPFSFEKEWRYDSKWNIKMGKKTELKVIYGLNKNIKVDNALLKKYK